MIQQREADGPGWGRVEADAPSAPLRHPLCLKLVIGGGGGGVLITVLCGKYFYLHSTDVNTEIQRGK